MGGGVPSLNNASSEYLVDTENNQIVYPYTKAENIIGLSNIEIPDKPGQLLGGVNPDSYFKSPTITAFSSISGNNYYITPDITLSAGIWIIDDHFWQDGGADGSNCAIVMDTRVGSEFTSCWIPSYLPYMHLANAMVVKITESASPIMCINSQIRPTSFTYIIRGIKLAEI